MDDVGEYSSANVTGKDTLDGNMGFEDFGENVNLFVCADQFDKSGMPWKGMEFNSIKEAYHFYSRYVKVRGFGTRKSIHYFRKTNGIYRKLFVKTRHKIDKQ